MTISTIPKGVILVSETEYYTDWKCSVCATWRPRTYAATVVTTSDGSRVRCREHGDSTEKPEEQCECHCHADAGCDECGEETGEKW